MTTNLSAAKEEDLREQEIRRIRKAVLKAHFSDLQPSTNAIIALEQAIHMLLAGI